MKPGGILDCSEHEMKVSRPKATSRVTNLDFRRTNFGFFKELLEKLRNNMECGTRKSGERKSLPQLKRIGL